MISLPNTSFNDFLKLVGINPTDFANDLPKPAQDEIQSDYKKWLASSDTKAKSQLVESAQNWLGLPQEANAPAPSASSSTPEAAPKLAGTTTSADQGTPLPGVPQRVSYLAAQIGIPADQLLTYAQNVPQQAATSRMTEDQIWDQIMKGFSHAYVSGIYNVPTALQSAQILTARGFTPPMPAPGSQNQADLRTGRMEASEGGGPTNQYSSLLDVLSQPNVEGWDSAKIKALQDQLVAAGPQYLQVGTFTPGVYDRYTIAAYTEILHLANMQQKTPQEILNDLAKANKQNKYGFQFEKPAFVRASDAQLKETLRQDLNQQFGRDPTAAELGAAMATYRKYEQSDYTNYQVPQAQYQQQASFNKQQGLPQPKAPTLTQMSPSDIEAAVTNQAEQTPEAQQYRGAKLGLSLMDLLARG